MILLLFLFFFSEEKNCLFLYVGRRMEGSQLVPSFAFEMLTVPLITFFFWEMGWQWSFRRQAARSLFQSADSGAWHTWHLLLIFDAKKPHYWSCPIMCSIRPQVRFVVSVACVSTCHTHMTSLRLVIDNIWLGFCNQYWLSMSPFDKSGLPSNSVCRIVQMGFLFKHTVSSTESISRLEVSVTRPTSPTIPCMVNCEADSTRWTSPTIPCIVNWEADSAASSSIITSSSKVIHESKISSSWAMTMFIPSSALSK